MKPFKKVQSAAYLALDALAGPLIPNKPHILLACMPKSASTFLATALSEVKGLRRCRLIPHGGGREQELCPTRLSRYNHCSYIAQQHTRYSAWTQQLITQYRMTPVVLVRDLADCVASIRDQYRREPQGVGPTAFFLPGHVNLSDAEIEDAIVRFSLPWYFNFYASWRSAKDVPIYDYEDYTRDSLPVMADILKHAGRATSKSELEDALAVVNKGQVAQFNVGKPGRGSELSPNAKDLLRAMLDFYPDFAQDPLFIKTRKTIG